MNAQVSINPANPETPNPAIVTQISVVWMTATEVAQALGTGEAAAMSAGRGFTLTSAQDCANFLLATNRSVTSNGTGYALSSANLASGMSYTPSVQVADSAFGIGVWVRGLIFTAITATTTAAPTTTTVAPTTTTAAPTGGIFSDSFVSSNGSAPNATYWKTPTFYQQGGSSSMTIQMNKLQTYLGGVGAAAWLEAASTVPLVANRTLSYTIGSTPPTGVNTAFMDLWVMDSASNFSFSGTLTNTILLRMQGDAIGPGLSIVEFSSAGGYFNQHLEVHTFTVGDVVKIKFNSSTSYTMYVNATIIGTFTTTATLGSNLKLGLYFSVPDATYRNFLANNVTVA